MAYKKNRENEIKEEDKSTRDQVNRLFLKVIKWKVKKKES